jgi:hypothetical protein
MRHMIGSSFKSVPLKSSRSASTSAAYGAD